MHPCQQQPLLMKASFGPATQGRIIYLPRNEPADGQSACYAADLIRHIAVVKALSWHFCLVCLHAGQASGQLDRVGFCGDAAVFVNTETCDCVAVLAGIWSVPCSRIIPAMWTMSRAGSGTVVCLVIAFSSTSSSRCSGSSPQPRVTAAALTVNSGAGGGSGGSGRDSTAPATL